MSKEPEYIAINQRRLDDFKDMPRVEWALLCCLMMECKNSREYGGVVVVLYPLLKKKMITLLGWKSTTSIDNVLQRLIKRGMVSRIDRGVYQLNPEIFLRKGGKRS